MKHINQLKASVKSNKNRINLALKSCLQAGYLHTHDALFYYFANRVNLSGNMVSIEIYVYIYT